uniref:Gp13 n=1 Tax=Edwardsiella phage eiMSLS TaxID=945085 RepID=E7EL18_9VIRU|nr:gp13 [Edwardsiella phage eiMSLS]
MSVSRIRALLEGHLSAVVVGLEYPLGDILVAWENTPTDRPSLTNVMLVPNLMPAESDSISLQQTDVIYQGIFQITAMIPAGHGTRAPEKLADDIAAAFPATLMLRDASGFAVGVSGPASVFNGLATDTGYNIPISVTYRALT